MFRYPKALLVIAIICTILCTIAFANKLADPKQAAYAFLADIFVTFGVYRIYSKKKTENTITKGAYITAKKIIEEEKEEKRKAKEAEEKEEYNFRL